LNIIDEISGGTHERHIYAGSLHIASNTSGGVVEFYHVDHLGSTRLKTNSTGGVTYGSNYEPFGVGCGEDGGEDYRYTGKREDITGLYYFGARYYDPTTGRFITRDKVFGKLTDPQSQNRYVYCRNNPNKYIDPDGKITIQLGYGGSASFLMFGVCNSEGIAINPNPYNIQYGTYTEFGYVTSFGGGASVSPQLTITPFSNDINDISGEYWSIGLNIAPFAAKGGLTINIPVTNGKINLWLFSVTVDIPVPLLSRGIAASIHSDSKYSKVYILSESESSNSYETIQVVPTHIIESSFTNFQSNQQSVNGWDEYDKHRGV
jgi:RHS repeat-associated protein